MQILFELTTAQLDKVARAGCNPASVPTRNMRLEMGHESIWAKCPVISGSKSSETLVLPDGQIMTRLVRKGFD